MTKKEALHRLFATRKIPAANGVERMWQICRRDFYADLADALDKEIGLIHVTDVTLDACLVADQSGRNGGGEI